MTEKGVAEAWLYTNLKGIAASFGDLPVRKLPFTIPQGGLKAPVLVWGFAAGRDVGTLGPGPRTHSRLTYEVSVFYPGDTLGMSYEVGGTTYDVIDVLSRLDEVFNDFSVPENVQGGIMLSCERSSPVEIPEQGDDGTPYRREGGLYVIYAKKSGSIP